jgi:hypothetical protein
MKETISDKIHNRHIIKYLGIIVLLLLMLVSNTSALTCQGVHISAIPVEDTNPNGPFKYYFVAAYDATANKDHVISTWDFGDKTPPLTTDIEPTHTYTLPGTYIVTLTNLDERRHSICTATTYFFIFGSEPAGLMGPNPKNNPLGSLPKRTKSYPEPS